MPQILKLKDYPSVFFIITIVVLSYMLLKFIPRFKSDFSITETYKLKFQIEYFPNTIRNLESFVKVKFSFTKK